MNTRVNNQHADINDPNTTKVNKKQKSLESEGSEDKRRSFVDSEDAKETIVWFIVKFILILCGCVCCVIIFTDIIINSKKPPTSQQLVSDIKSLWETFSSILTLSLGYLFGKESKKKKKNSSDY